MRTPSMMSNNCCHFHNYYFNLTCQSICDQTTSDAEMDVRSEEMQKSEEMETNVDDTEMEDRVSGLLHALVLVEEILKHMAESTSFLDLKKRALITPKLDFNKCDAVIPSHFLDNRYYIFKF